MVGNNVLDLLDTLPGFAIEPAGDAFNTINGLGIDTINVRVTVCRRWPLCRAAARQAEPQ